MIAAGHNACMQEKIGVQALRKQPVGAPLEKRERAVTWIRFEWAATFGPEGNLLLPEAKRPTRIKADANIGKAGDIVAAMMLIDKVEVREEVSKWRRDADARRAKVDQALGGRTQLGSALARARLLQACQRKGQLLESAGGQPPAAFTSSRKTPIARR